MLDQLFESITFHIIVCLLQNVVIFLTIVFPQTNLGTNADDTTHTQIPFGINLESGQKVCTVTYTHFI